MGKEQLLALADILNSNDIPLPLDLTVALLGEGVDVSSL